MLILQNDLIEILHSHAQKEYPRECCGILMGKRLDQHRLASNVIQTENRKEENSQTTRFQIHPLEIFKAEEEGEREDLEIVGFYHSHPDYEAVPSLEDSYHMITGYSYLILSVKNGLCVNMNSYEKITQMDTGAEEILVKEK